MNRELADMAAQIDDFPELPSEDWPESMPTEVDSVTIGEIVGQGGSQSPAYGDQEPTEFPEGLGTAGYQHEWPEEWPTALQSEPVQFPEPAPGTTPAQPSEFPESTAEQVGYQHEWPEDWPTHQAYDGELGTAAPQRQEQPFIQQQDGMGGVSFSMYSDSQEQGGMPDGSSPLGDKKEDASLYDLLKQIADGMSALTQGAKQAGTQQDAGAKGYQFPWTEQGFQPLEQSEDFAGASPAFDVTTMNGTRGAGGWGFGSKAGANAPSDFFDPSRRATLGM